MSAWLGQALAGSAALMALVLATRGWLRRCFGPSMAYALWLVPAVRLVMPPLPGLASLFDVVGFHGWHAVMVSAAARDAPRLGLFLAGAAWPILPIWLAGFLIWLSVQTVRYHTFIRTALRQSIMLSDTDGISVLLSSVVKGPLATGIFNRRIFLPPDFGARYATEERRLALLHERCHHSRFDLVANLVALVVTAAHWWNPLAHWSHRCFRRDQELACDADVASTLTATGRAHYSRALLKSATHMPVLACALSHRDEIKARLLSLSQTSVGRAHTRFGVISMTALSVAGLVGTASEHGSTAEVGLTPDPPQALARAKQPDLAAPPSGALHSYETASRPDWSEFGRDSLRIVRPDNGVWEHEGQTPLRASLTRNGDAQIILLVIQTPVWKRAGVSGIWQL